MRDRAEALMKEDELRKRGIARNAQDFEVAALNLNCFGLGNGKGHGHGFGGVSGIIRLISQGMPVTR